jgi:hypothetical protein
MRRQDEPIIALWEKNPYRRRRSKQRPFAAVSGRGSMGPMQNRLKATSRLTLVAVIALVATVSGPFTRPANAYNTYPDKCRWGNSENVAVIVYRNSEQAGPMNAHYRAIEEHAIDNYNNAGQGRYRLVRAEDNPAARVVMEFNSHLYPSDPHPGWTWIGCTNRNPDPIVYVILNQSRTDFYMEHGYVDTVTAIEHQEVGHSLGLDHVVPDEACNVMSDPFDSFFPSDGYCYTHHMGTFLKTDDINGLWYLYPVPDPPPPKPNKPNPGDYVPYTICQGGGFPC